MVRESDRLFKETVKRLMADLDDGRGVVGVAERVGHVLDVTTDAVLHAFDGRRRPSPRKGVRLGPAREHWGRPGPKPAESCLRGHGFTDENTITRANGTKTCRECHRARVRAHEKLRPRRNRRAS